MNNNLTKFLKSDYIRPSKLSIQMSDMYHEIAKENYQIYKINIKELTNAFKRLILKLDNLFDLAGDEIIKNDMIPEKIDKFTFLKNTNKSKTELILNYPSESKEVFEIMLNSILKTEAAQEIDDLLEESLETFDMNKVIKSGITAIAFEAFACEALINQEIKEFMSNNQIDKLKKIKGRPVYILKTRKIIERKKIKCDFNALSAKLKGLMEIRNKIVYFKEYSYNLFEMFHYIESIEDKDNNEHFYIGDLLNSLDDNCEVYEELKKTFNCS